MALVVPFLSGAVLAFAPGAASACSCAAPLGYDFLYPPPGSNAVPPDARMWVNADGRCEGYSPCSPGATPALRLFRAGVEVDGRLGLLQSGTSAIVVLSPLQRLPVGSGYELRGPRDHVVSTFTVAELVPHEPPAPPRLVRSEPVVEVGEGEGSCEPAYGFALHLAPTGLFTVLDVAGEATLAEGSPAGTVSELTDEAVLSLGEGGCLFGWPGAEPGASTMVRFGSFHPDGTFSGWSSWTFLQVPMSGAGDEPSAGGCGCSTSSPGPVAGILLLTLACAAWLGRRTT